MPSRGAALALTLLLPSSVALAADPPSIPASLPCLLRCTGAHVLDEGAVAPCSGVLVPEVEAREAALCVAVGLPGCRVEVIRLEDTARVEAQKRDALAAADASEIAALRQALAVARRPAETAWYERPWVVAVAAGVVGVGLGVGIGWAVTR